MSKVRSGEAGFSPRKAAWVVVIVAVAGVVGWFIYQNLSKTTGTAVRQTTPVSGLYAGWYTYRSPSEKFTIKYPRGWTVATEPPDGNVRESATLQGPHDFNLVYTLVKYDPTFTVSAAKNQASAVGNPDPVKANAYHAIDSFTPVHYTQPLYVVSTSTDVGEPGGPVDSLELAAYSDYAAQQLGYPGYYVSKNASGDIVQWSGGYHKPAPGSGPLGMPLATFLAKEEVKTAILILKSISY